MKIALDARMRFHRGVGTCLRGLFPELVKLLPEHEWLVLQRADGKWDCPGAVSIPCDTPPLSAAEHWRVPRLLKQHRVDWLLVPHFNVPLGWPVEKSFAVIHDTIPLLFPETFRWFVPSAVRFLLARTVRGAAAVITDSQATAAELKKLSDREVRVVHPGLTVPPPTGAVPPPPARPFIFAIGGKPHKNAVGAIRTFEQLATPGLALKLRQSAREDGGAAARAAAASPARDRIELIEEMTEPELWLAYRQARAFLFLSRWEGFGYPPLEAMAAGTPVVASNAGALPEVLGDAAILVAPNDYPGAARNLDRFLADPGLRADYAARGRERVKQYVWPAAAAAVADIIMTRCATLTPARAAKDGGLPRGQGRPRARPLPERERGIYPSPRRGKGKG